MLIYVIPYIHTLFRTMDIQREPLHCTKQRGFGPMVVDTSKPGLFRYFQISGYFEEVIQRSEVTKFCPVKRLMNLVMKF